MDTLIILQQFPQEGTNPVTLPQDATRTNWRHLEEGICTVHRSLWSQLHHHQVVFGVIVCATSGADVDYIE